MSRSYRKMARGRLVLVLVAAMVGLFVVAGCGGDDDVASSAQDTCEALGEFRDSGLAIQALDPTSASLDDLEDARGDAEDALEDVLESADATRAAAVDELQSAFDEFENTVDENSDLPLPDLISAVLPQIQNVVDTWNQINQDLQCTAAE